MNKKLDIDCDQFLETVQEGIWMADPDMKTTFVNMKMAKMLGYKPSEMIDKSVFNFMDEETKKLVSKKSLQRKNGLSDTYESYLKHKEGHNIEVEIRSAPVIDKDGNYCGLVAGISDITETKKIVAEQEILLNNIQIQVWYLTNEYTYGFVNKAHAEFNGFKVEDIAYQSMYDKFAKEKVDFWRKTTSKVFKQKTIQHMEEWVFNSDGEKKLLSITKIPKLDKNGNVEFVVCSAEDITEYRRVQIELKKQGDNLKTITENMTDLVAKTDVFGNFVYTSESSTRVLGYEEKEFYGRSVFEFVHKEDLPSIMKSFAKSVSTLTNGKAEYRIKKKNGEYLWVETIGNLLFEKGKLKGIVFSTRDITDRKITENNLIQSEERAKRQRTVIADLALDDTVLSGKSDIAFDKITEAVSFAMDVERISIWFLNEDGSKLSCQSLFEKSMNKHTSGDTLSIKDFPIYFSEITKQSRISVSNAQKSDQTKELRERYLKPLNIISILDAAIFNDGKLRGIVSFESVDKVRKWHTDEEVFASTIASIISQVLINEERKKVEEKLIYISTRDSLTGLYNRRHFDQMMEENKIIPTSIIALDVNGLKIVNDTYGHLVGDEFLIKATEIIKNSCRTVNGDRPADVIARWGGDEFMILLPGIEKETACEIGNRIKTECIGVDVEGVPISMAVGVATKRKKSEKLINILKEAEDEMYRNKLMDAKSHRSHTVFTLIETLAVKSHETDQHVKNMQEAAHLIAEKMKLSVHDYNKVDLAVLLHDIGKITLPESILNKTTKLTDEEWKRVKKHPQTGYRILKATDEFSHVAEEVLHHHENYNGTGYPHGIKGEEIPIVSRIVAVADAYEVMSNGRPYKKAMTKENIINEFKRCSGTQFDASVCEILIDLLESGELIKK